MFGYGVQEATLKGIREMLETAPTAEETAIRLDCIAAILNTDTSGAPAAEDIEEVKPPESLVTTYEAYNKQG